MRNRTGPSLFELAKQALSSTKDGYNLLAPNFDNTPYRTPDELVEEMAKYFPDGAKSAIDVCCGTGAGIKALIAQPNLERIVGVDFSAGMLTEARQNFGHDSRIEWQETNVLAMEFEQGFDLAICLGALGHFKEREYRQFLERVFAAISPGGQYLFLVGELPKPWTRLYWFCKFFNLALWIRNWLIKPEFIMYYHQYMFVSDPLIELLKQVGFTVDVGCIELPGKSDGLVQSGFRLVTASRV